MKAILLSAGFGTRLRPLTKSIPKCLVPICGKPLLQIWFENLSKAKISNFLVNTHYLPDQVSRFILASRFKKQVKLKYEPKLLGTAGTLMENIDFYSGKDGLLIHADNYCLEDFSDFIKAHQTRPKKCAISMMTFLTDDPSSCGIVTIDQDSVVTGFYEKVDNPPGNIANGAIYILSEDFISELLQFRESRVMLVDFSLDVLPKYIGRIFAYQAKNPLIDIGSIKNYLRANEDCAKII
jgi:mannose-1-phosphate guanylyltransferase